MFDERKTKTIKLSTIQKREKLNEVYALDEKGPGGAYHNYIVLQAGTEITPIRSDCPVMVEVPDGSTMACICLQKGPRKDRASQHGVLDTDLLEIVRHRLHCFQTGEFSSEYNAEALEHIEAALHAMNRRVEDRINRQVLGTYNK